MASGDKLVTLPAGQMQVSPADSPALNVAVMLVEFGAGDVPPGEDLHNFFRRVAEEPRADVLSRIQIEERDAPVALHDVADDPVRPQRWDRLTHRPRIVHAFSAGVDANVAAVQCGPLVWLDPD